MPTATTSREVIVITAPDIRTIVFKIRGTAPFMQARFSEKAREAMRSKQIAGSTAKKGAKREPRDFDSDFQQAMHVATEGWVGIPASAFRGACIDACRLVGFQMTKAKMSIFVEADGLDKMEGIPLVRLESDQEPERSEMAVRNATGVLDLRLRPMWRQWGATVRVRYDADQFTAVDVANLLARAGAQVGIGEGRPFSKQSNGLGFGLFEITDKT